MSGSAFARIPRLVLALWLFAGSLASEPSLVPIPSIVVSIRSFAARSADSLDEARPLPTIAHVSPAWAAGALSLAILDLPETSLPRREHVPVPAEPVESTSTPDAQAPAAVETGVALGPDDKWIDVDLSEQRIVAYAGGEALHTSLISSGLPRHPTVLGQFHIYLKVYAQRMKGGDPEMHDDYDLPGVPNVMYFYEDYSIHGAYWHHNFGHPMSHGCVNLPLDEAQWFFDWAPLGTLVLVHE